MTSAPADLGARLRAAREEAGLSLQQVCDRTGMSKAYLLRLERDPTANPSVETLFRLAGVLNTTVADLLGQSPVRAVSAPGDADPPSLREFIAADRPTPGEIRMLRSIRFRKSEVPTSAERWRTILAAVRG